MREPRWELATLKEIGRILFENPELANINELIVKTSVALGNADAAWIALYLEKGSSGFLACNNISSESSQKLEENLAEFNQIVLSHGNKPVILEDLTAGSEILKELAIRESLSSAALVPIAYNQNIYGLLIVFWKRTIGSLSEQVEPILLIANQAGIAIENIRLLNQSRRWADALNAVFKVIQMIGTSPRMSVALNVIMDESKDLFGTDKGLISLLDTNTQVLKVRASRGFSKYALKKIKAKSGQGIEKWVVENKGSLIVNDVSKDKRFSYFPLDKESVSSLLSVPLIVDGKVKGVITLLSSEQRNFTSEDENLLMVLASGAAAAIENFRLYEQAKSRLSEERMLYRLAQYLSSTNDVPTALELTLTSLCSFFHAKYGSIRLLDESGKFLQPGAIFGQNDEYSKMVYENLQISMDSPSDEQNPVVAAVNEGAVCAISNIFRNRRFASWRERAKLAGFGSLVCIPMIATDKPLGVISLFFRGTRRLQPTEYEFLQTAARTAAIALQRTILGEKLLKEEISMRALEEVSRLKTEFVSLVSHELRTPLTSIMGYVKLMLDGHSGELNDLQSEFLNTVSKNTERLIAIVSDLLDISRIESGRLKLAFEALDLASIVDREIESLRSLLEEKSIPVIIDIKEDLPQVKADSQKLGQIISNLLSNAIKYSPEGSFVRISASQIGKNVIVKVVDAGIGIPAEEHGKVFQRFYRSADDNVRSTKGTGLGLAITRFLVEMHGGKIWVESERGKGSTFSFSIPAMIGNV